jgi:hypothetical protein
MIALGKGLHIRVPKRPDHQEHFFADVVRANTVNRPQASCSGA